MSEDQTQTQKEETQEEPEYTSGTPFDPDRFVGNIPGTKRKYMEVKWRIVWFRQVHPEGTIDTELVSHDRDRHFLKPIYTKDGEKIRDDDVYGEAIFKAVVTTGKGGKATGHKMENALGFPDYLEKAETGSVGRALAELGFGTQFAPEFQEQSRIVDSPVATQPVRSSVSSVAGAPRPPAPTQTPKPPTTPAPAPKPVAQAPQAPAAPATITHVPHEAPAPPMKPAPSVHDAITPPGHFRSYKPFDPYLGVYEQKAFVEHNQLEPDTLTKEDQEGVDILLTDWFESKDGIPSGRARWMSMPITDEQYKEINGYWNRQVLVPPDKIRGVVDKVTGKTGVSISKGLTAFQADQAIWIFRHGVDLGELHGGWDFSGEKPPFVTPQLKEAA